MRLRKVTIFSGLATAVFGIGFAAAAFACTALATLQTATASTAAGSTVTATGTAFSAKAAAPVIIHWNGVGGPEVGRATPDANGNISAPIAVPRTAEPGQYVLVATQADAKGEPVYGTPARASIAVTGPDGKVPAAAPAAASGPAQPVSSSGGNGVVALTMVLGAVGLTLFGAGFATLVRSGRRSQPAAAPASHR